MLAPVLASQSFRLLTSFNVPSAVVAIFVLIATFWLPLEVE